MTLFSLGETKVKISILMLACGILWCFSGNGMLFLTISFAVLLHEFFHSICAKCFGYVTESITLYPYGGSALISDIDGEPLYCATVALAGPLFSLLTAFLYENGVKYGILPVWREFCEHSYAISVINLLPVYPLDGGRVLICLFERFFGKKGRKTAKIISVAIACLVFVLSLCQTLIKKDAEFLTASVFIMFSSVSSLKQNNSFMRKRGNSTVIRSVKAVKGERLITVFQRFAGLNYNTVFVFDGKGKLCAIHSEDEIKEMLLNDSTGCI